MLICLYSCISVCVYADIQKCLIQVKRLIADQVSKQHTCMPVCLHTEMPTIRDSHAHNDTGMLQSSRLRMINASPFKRALCSPETNACQRCTSAVSSGICKVLLSPKATSNSRAGCVSGLTAALDRLNEITKGDFQYFGIEVKVWQIRDSVRAPQFEVVSSPNDWSRTVSQHTQRAVESERSETQLQKQRFWKELRDYMIQAGSRLRCPKPGPWGFLIFSIGRTDFSMETSISKQKEEIGIRLYTKGEHATAYFHLLKAQREDIEQEFGESLEWADLPQRESCRISLKKGNTDPTDENDWKNQHEWLTSKLALFDQVFRSRIKALDADDSEPLEDDDEILDP